VGLGYWVGREAYARDYAPSVVIAHGLPAYCRQRRGPRRNDQDRLTDVPFVRPDYIAREKGYFAGEAEALRASNLLALYRRPDHARASRRRPDRCPGAAPPKEAHSYARALHRRNSPFPGDIDRGELATVSEPIWIVRRGPRAAAVNPSRPNEADNHTRA